MLHKFFALALILVVALFTVNAQVVAQSGKGYSAEVPFERKSVTTQIYWKNAANRDTSIRVFTGAAAVYDTSNEAIWIGGANTIALFDSIAVQQDTVAYFQVYLQVSADKSAWFNYLRGTGAAATATAASRTVATWAAVDSASGAMGLTTPTSSANAVMTAVNVPSVPTWANWMRVIAYKHNSASSDSVSIKTKVVVHSGDE